MNEDGSFTKKKKKATSTYVMNSDGSFSKLKDEEEEEEKKKRNQERLEALFERGRQQKEAQAESKKDDDGFDFVKAGTFGDGTSFTEAPIDLAVGGINTVADLGGKVLKGGLGFFEGVSDLILHGAGYAAGAVGLDKQATWLHNEANIKAVDNMFKGYEELVEPYSFAGKTTQAVAEGVGQMAPIVATSGVASAAGLGKLGTSVATTALTGASGIGSGMSEAYRDGATDSEAAAYGVIAGTADAMTELLFGGLGKSVKAVGLGSGLTSADDMLAKAISSKIKNITAKNVTEMGVKMGAEGLEEVLAGAIQAFGKSITYKKEEEGWTLENFQQLLKDENLLEQFVVAALTSGVAQSGVVPGMKNGSLIEANKTGRDLITGNTQNEQAVIDAEINERIAEAEKDGKKLTGQQKNKIRDQVAEDMEKGYISTDTIEKTLGGTSYSQFQKGVEDFKDSETYKAYNDAVAEEKSLREEFEELQKVKITDADLGQQNRFNEVKNRLEEIKKEAKTTALRKELDAEIERINGLKDRLSQEVSEKVKGERLSESYREFERSKQKFQADPAEYDNEYARKTVQNIVDSEIANNTNETREFVDFMAKISADKGVVFSLTDTKRLAGTRYAKDGAKTNAYVTDSGDIVINVKSDNRLNSLVGHEVTHVLEGTELYGKLQEAVFAYAQKKGDYDSRLKAITELYQKHDPKADPEMELTADLVGDYIFTDRDFVYSLSTEHRNVFQKIYDEIKYLVKVATAGSKEARALEKAKKMFAEAYRENVKGKPSGEHYNITALEDGKVYVSASRKVINGTTLSEQRQDVTNFFSTLLQDNPSLDIHTIEGDVLTITRNETANKARDNYKTVDGKRVLLTDEEFAVKLHAEAHIDELAEVSTKMSQKGDTKDHQFAQDGFTYRRAYFEDFDGEYYEITLSIGHNGTVATVYNVGKIEKSVPPSAKVIAVVGSKPLGETHSKNSISQNSEKSIGEAKKSTGDDDIRFSLSEDAKADNKGRELSVGQAEYFKNSKIRDNDGNLLTMYHGSRESFTAFDRKKAKSSGTYGSGFYFSNSESHAGTYGETYEVYLNIKNPLQDGDRNITKDQLRNFVQELADNEDYGLDNYGYGATVDSVTNSVYGKSDFAMLLDLNISVVGNMVEAVELFNQVNGTNYDGIVAPTETVAFYSEQIKAVSNINPTSAPDIRYSLSTSGDAARTGGGYAVYGDNIRVRDKSEFDFAPLPPVQETVQETSTVTDTEDYPIMDNSAPMTEEDANSYDGLEGITDADAPPVMDAPYYGENEEAAPTDPFEDRDIKDVGNRKVKAYMYENPEVKPFFQEEANVMLGDLQNTTKGKRYYLDDVYYNSGGEAGWYGEKRETTEDIAYLLDELGYSYADIEKGLNAIIEDDGKENNAISKRIEFLLNDRLMNGYNSFGIDIPPNQDYINLLNEKQIIEYNEEARKKFFDVADDFAPMVETEELPMRETTPTITEQVKDNIEPIEPTQTVSTDGTAIKTVKERLAAKVRAVETEIAENRRLREESIRDYDAEIAQKEAEYAAKNNKNTKAANDILRRIERLKRFKSSVDADYAKRISDLEEKATKANEELRSGESTTEQAAMRRDLHSTIIERAKEKFAERGFDFDEVLKNAKDLSTFSTVDNTPQRVMEKALGYKEGQTLADLTVNKVAQNETEGIRWLNSFTNRKKGLLAEISNRYHIKPGSKESAAAQMYAEGFYVNGKNEVVEYGDRELALDFPNARTRENIKGLATDPRIRQIYDETLDKINESRARNAFPEIKKLDNYYLHFRAMDDTFSKLGIPFNPNDIRAKDLPTDLNGVTADLKPGQPYFSSAMHRRGNRTSFDLLGGLERYLTSAKDQIYHIDDIQTLRAMRNYVADSFGQAKGLEDLDLLTEEEAQAKIEQVYNSHLSTFAKFLNEEANVIAGKTALIDRGLEGVVGRRGMTIIDTINRQVGANMVGFNVSSSLTNFLAPVQAFAKTNKAAFTKAFAQTVFNKVGSVVGKTDGFIENNPTMIRRQGAERFYRTPWQKAGDAGYALMGAVDSISTELIVRAKYNELKSKGMSEQDAVAEADKWASRLMGDRSLGQQPQLYNSKTLGILTKFQLEVRNQLDSQFYDTIQEAKVSNEEIQNALWRNTKTAAKVTSTFFQLAVAQHLFGKVFESIAGYNPAFDIIEAIIKTFGWDDEEDSEDTFLDNIGQGFLSMLEDMPYSSLATGGRVPMASALPIEQLIKGKDQYGNEKSRLETVKETIPYYVLPGGYGQIKKTTQGLGMFDDSLPIAGSYTDSGSLRFPVDETPKNIAQAAIFGQYASGNARDYFDNERQPLKENQLQEFIDVDIPIREYWDYREGLKDLQTIDEKFDYIASLDLPIDKKNILVNNVADRKEPVDLTDYDEFKDYEEFDYAVKNPEKYEFLQSVGVSVDEYQSFDEDTKDVYSWAYNNPEKYEFVKSLGISLDDYKTFGDDAKDAITWAYNNPEGYTVSKAVSDDVVTYREYAKALNEIGADKDADGKSISGSRKEKVLNYINGLDIGYGEKLILFKNEYNADDTYNYEIIDYLNNRNDLSYAETETILKKLGFNVDADGNISW